MISIKDKFNSYKEEIDWVDDEYNSEYAQYFECMKTLNNKLKHSTISNDELEDALLRIPLDMIEVSEKLDKLKLVKDVTKIDIKFAKDSNKNKDTDYDSYSDEIFVRVVDSLIDRVEKQISFSKEFVMSCKKIWDSRTNNSSPIAPLDSADNLEDLPNYES